MKSIGIVLAFFGFICTGIVLFTLQQSQKVETQIRAQNSKPLFPVLIDDCNIQFSHECTEVPQGVSLNPYLIYYTQTILKKSPNKNLQSYTEQLDPTFFTDYDGTPKLTPQKDSYSLPEILTLTAANTRVQPKIILALMRLQSPEIWNSTDGNIKDILKRNESTLAHQIKQLSIFIRNTIRTERAFPTKLAIIGGTNYAYEPHINIGSRVIYGYLSTKAKSTDEYERWVSFTQSSNKDHIWKVWQELYGVPAFSNQPHFLPEE